MSQEGREPSAKPQVLSAAQRIWNSRPGVSATPAAAEQPAFERTYSWECADEIGVPIGVVQEVLTRQGRDRTAKPRVISMAQKIWSSRNLKYEYVVCQTLTLIAGPVQSRLALLSTE